MTYFLYSSSYNPSLIQNALFEFKLLSQDSIEQGDLSKYVKKFGSNKKINFSTESFKKSKIYDLLDGTFMAVKLIFFNFSITKR